MDTNISISDLKLMKCEDIKDLLTREIALAISQQHFNENPTNSVDILFLWLDTLSRSFFDEDGLDLEHVFLRKLLAKLYVKNIAGYRNYIQHAHEFLNWARDLFGSKEDVLSKWILFFLKDELDLIDFCLREENANNEQLTELMSLIMSLHHLILTIIDSALHHLSKNYADESDCKLSKTIVELCRLGQRLESLNFRCFTKNLTVVTNLCVHYLKFGNYTTPVPDWYSYTTGLLLNGAGKYLNTVYQSDSRKDSNDTIQKYLHLIKFNLRLLNKIVQNNSYFIGSSFIDLIYKFIKNFYRMPKCVKNPEIPKMLNELGLHEELFEFLQVICQKRHYHELLLENASSNFENDTIVFKLICATLKAELESDKMLSEESSMFYGKLFKLLFKGTFVFTKLEEYDTLVVLFSALLAKDEKCCLINFLRSQVISDNLPYSHTSTDILLIKSRIFPDLISRDEALHEYHFWLQVNNAYRVDSMAISQLQVHRILRNSFEICRLSRLNISNKELHLNNDLDISRDFRQLHCIGWQHIFAPKLITKIERALLNISTSGISLKDFREMIACLRLFEDKPNILLQGGEKIMIKLTNLCQTILMEHHNENNNSHNYYTVFMNAFFALLLKSSNKTRLQILSQLAKYNKVLLKFTSWYLIKFFFDCSHIPSEWQNLAKQFINDVNISNAGPKMCKLLLDDNDEDQSEGEQQSPPGKRLRLMEKIEPIITTRTSTTSFKKMIVEIDAQINNFLPAKYNLDEQDIRLLSNVMKKLINIAKSANSKV